MTSTTSIAKLYGERSEATELTDKEVVAGLEYLGETLTAALTQQERALLLDAAKRIEARDLVIEILLDRIARGTTK